MEVAAAFKSQGFEFGEGDDVAKECLAMCHHFQASPEDLATSWDSYYTVNQAKMKTHVPTAAHMEAFRAHFERHVASAKKSNAVKTPQAYVYGKRSLAESLESGALDVEMADAAVDASLAAVTPGRKGDTPGAKTAGARAAHARAQGLGATAGVQLPARDAAAALEARCVRRRAPPRSPSGSGVATPRPSWAALCPRPSRARARARASTRPR